jgi:hypothetical protein
VAITITTIQAMVMNITMSMGTVIITTMITGMVMATVRSTMVKARPAFRFPA